MVSIIAAVLALEELVLGLREAIVVVGLVFYDGLLVMLLIIESILEQVKQIALSS